MKKLIFVFALTGLAACAPSANSVNSSALRIVPQNVPLNLVNAGPSSMAAPLSLGLTLTFDILPPAASSTGNLQTYASDITINGNYAYTAFNTVGAPQAGAVDVINLGLLGALPYIDSSKYFSDFDVNTAVYSAGDVWALGAKNDIGAHIKKFPVSLGNLGTVAAEIDMVGHAGTGLAVSGGNLVASVGANAGVQSVNATSGAVAGVVNVNDARDIKVLANGDLLVLSGGSCLASSGVNNCDTSVGTKTPPRVTRYTSAGVVVWSTDLVGATIAQSKSALVSGSTYAAASLGDGGLSMLCLADGAIMNTVAPRTLSGVAPELTVTNAVAAIPGMLVTADGAAGVSLYQIESSTTGPTSACAKVKLTALGTTTFNDGSSVNNVSSGNFTASIGLLGVQIYAGRIYAAAGAKGFRTIDLNFQLTAATTIISL